MGVCYASFAWIAVSYGPTLMFWPGRFPLPQLTIGAGFSLRFSALDFRNMRLCSIFK
jgi:hypothetical protein